MGTRVANGTRWAERGLLCLALLGLVQPVLLAQPVVEELPGQSVRREVEEQFTVVPIRGGLVLTPREDLGISGVEVSAGEVAVDGAVVDEEELEALLGEETAAVVFQLSELEGEELAALFRRPAEEPSAEALLEEEAESYEPIPLDEEVAPAVPSAPRPPRRDRDEWREKRSGSRVVFGNSVRVEEDEEISEVVVIGGSVDVDGAVSGDVVAVGGPLRVRGFIGGDAVSVGGGVHLYSTAEVEGEVTSVGGRVRQDPGARAGDVQEVDFLGEAFEGWGDWSDCKLWDWRRLRWRAGPWWSWHDFRDSVEDLFSSALSLVVLGVFGGLAVLLFRRRLETVAHRAGREPWKAGAIGLTAMILYVPLLVMVIVLLAISIVGIPLLLLVPFAVLASIVAAVFGYFAVAYQLGRWSERRFGLRLTGPVVALILGLFWIHGWTVLADLLDVLDGPKDFTFLAVAMLVLFGFLVQLSAWSVGIGAMIIRSPALPAGYSAVTGEPPPPPPAVAPPTNLPAPEEPDQVEGEGTPGEPETEGGAAGADSPETAPD